MQSSLVQDRLCEVAYQIPLSANYYRLGLKSDIQSFVPGQFAMIEVPRLSGVLLRRPFSLARHEKNITEILYKVVGKGTLALSQVAVGKKIKMLGPLGHGFSEIETSSQAIAVAGGYGIAPFYELAQIRKNLQQDFTIYYGARSQSDLLYLDQFRELGVELRITTEDGSMGLKGRIIDLLKQDFAKSSPQKIWSCGPMGLLAAIKEWGETHQLDAELSIEEAMGCGTGICLGCVVKNQEGQYIRACKEGPVFCGSEINLDE